MDRNWSHCPLLTSERLYIRANKYQPLWLSYSPRIIYLCTSAYNPNVYFSVSPIVFGSVNSRRKLFSSLWILRASNRLNQSLVKLIFAKDKKWKESRDDWKIVGKFESAFSLFWRKFCCTNLGVKKSSYLLWSELFIESRLDYSCCHCWGWLERGCEIHPSFQRRLHRTME